MKNLLFSLTFSVLVSLSPALHASVVSKSGVTVIKGDDKKKKKKSCDGASKENCAKGKKACCQKGAAATPAAPAQ